MRTHSRYVSKTEEEPGGYSLSISDLMAALTLIFIIAAAALALQLRLATKKVTTIDERAKEEVIQLLNGVSKDIDPGGGNKVDVVEDQTIIRFRESILFPSGSAELSEDGRRVTRELAVALASNLPCYTKLSPEERQARCGSQEEKVAQVEVILIEGHTDDVPIRFGAKYRSNWDLSAARAYQVYSELVNAAESLADLENYLGQPVLAISGFADTRPIEHGGSEEARRRNRRIDLRFLTKTRKIEREEYEQVAGQ